MRKKRRQASSRQASRRQASRRQASKRQASRPGQAEDAAGKQAMECDDDEQQAAAHAADTSPVGSAETYLERVAYMFLTLAEHWTYTHLRA